jgi:uncharacterized protein YndB with AHSA1/START domain
VTYPQASLQTINGKPVLRFERRLAHPPAKVWRAITEPAELAHWFPAAVEAEPRVGAEMRFTFPDEAPVDGMHEGEILELDPPKVYAFRWDEDVLRFELIPDGDGTLLVFTHTIGGGWIGRLGAGRNAAGWDVCLDALVARLADREFEEPTDWLGPVERYAEEFGLGEGSARDTADGFLVHFARDLMWKPVDEMWAMLVEDAAPAVGGTPPARSVNPHVPAGPITAVAAPRVLEYEWRHDGAAAGRVRWEITHDPRLGVRVELTQTVPARHAGLLPTVLAAWQVHLELFFAATFGEIRCPWPADRVEYLTKQYADRFK